MKVRKSKKSVKSPITVSMFHKRHPDLIQNVGELFYTRVANRVYAAIVDCFDDYFEDNSVLANIAIDMAAYLEDKVTGLNIWNAYEVIHRQKYETPFPFYDISSEERYADEPNRYDVRLLVSYDMNRYIEEGKFVNVLSSNSADAADKIMAILDEEYEYAPENTPLRDWLYDAKAYEDPQQMRERMIFLFLSSYLTRVYDLPSLYDKYADMDYMGDYLEYDDHSTSYMKFCFIVMQTRIGPAAEQAGRWLAEMVRLSGVPEVSRNACRFDNFRSVPELSLYEVVDVDKKRMIVKTPCRNTITVSFDMLNDETKRYYRKGIQFFTHLFFYDNCWQINGISQIYYIKNPEQVDKNCTKLIKLRRHKKRTYETLLKRNGGRPIGVAKDLDGVIRKLKLNKTLNLSAGDYEKETREYKNVLYFIPKGEDVRVFPDFARAVKLPYNRLYDREYAMDMGMQLTLSDALPDDMRRYILENNLMPESLFPGASDDRYNHTWYKQNRMCLSDMLHTDSRISLTIDTYDTLFTE